MAATTDKYPHLELDPIAPGRGAWKLTGGLLPLTPTSKSKTGYYRRALAPEVMVGRAGYRLAAVPAPDFHQRMVWYGTREFQRRLGLVDDGLLGEKTEVAIMAFQKDAGLEQDGILGPATAKAIFTPLIRIVAAAHKISPSMLGGCSVWESGLDPAAVGVNGLDLGLAQINTGAHEVTMAQATNAEFALNFTAKDMAATMTRWRGKTTVSLTKIAIANHNNPSLAKQWATTGQPPFSQSREDNGFPQIDEYVASVLAAGEAFA